MQNSLLGKSLVGQVHSRVERDISLVLHDTSTEDDVNLNMTLLEKLTPVAPAPPPPASTSTVSADAPEFIPESASTVPMSAAINNPLQTEQLLSSDLASLKSLVPVTPPNLGEFFDVTVTLAASPSNFTVRSKF